MGFLKKLASQTAVYGLSSMLGRFINFLLIIPQTMLFDSVDSYGQITIVFGTIAFLNIVLSYGMETAYFNFIRQGNDAHKVYATAQKSVILSTLLFGVLVILFIHQSAALLGYPEHTEFVWCCVIFLVFDTLSVLPFARLRFEEKPWQFATIKLVNIFINVGLNVFLLRNTPDFLKPYGQVTLVLIANAAASIASFILLAPLVFKINVKFDKVLYKKMLHYAWPLIFVGLAGIVNETLDRVLLKRLLPASEADYQAGIYGAFYKLTMVMTMFVQAFRFAAEPFFFKQKESNESRQIYATIMYWFTGVCAFIFLACMLFVNDLAALFIRDQKYFTSDNGIAVVPILLLANLFLGIYYNLSIWYKLSNRTKLAAIVAIGGALLTIYSNIVFIPLYGFTACAWITLAVYAAMCLAAFILGQKYFKVPYQVWKIVLIIMLSLGFWQFFLTIESHISEIWMTYCTKLALLGVIFLIIWLLQPKVKKA